MAKKLSIKTITCHDVYNVGASLQAYALSVYLQQLGHFVEIIDYKPSYLQHYKLWGVNNPVYNRPVLREIYNLLKLPRRLLALGERRKKNFDRFTKTYLPITKKRYSSFSQLQKDPPQADVYLAGSDQIWNTLFQNGRDPAFYLTFVPRKKVKASYAASFAVQQIEERYTDIIRRWLQGLDYISVREKSGVELAASLGVQACQVTDPVFLLSLEYWEKVAIYPQIQEQYVLVYDFDGNETLHREATWIAQKNGWKVWSIFPCAEADRCFYDAGPLEFIGLVHNAKIVLSNSFHATAFSIIFRRPFRVFDRQEEINTRMRDLLLSVGIQGNGTDSFKEVHQRLREQVESSKQYIDCVLETAERKKK